MGNSRFRIESEANRDPFPFGTLRWISHPGSTSAQQLTAMDVRLLPRKGHAFHKHPDQEEVLFVVAGRLEQWIEREMRILGPGDAVFIPPGVVHASFNAGEEELRMLVVFSPSVGEMGFVAVELAEESPWRELRVA